MPSESRRVANAFTLVELLVVIGIIALLISVLLPALSGARKMARRTAELSDMKNYTAACIMYTQEFKGWWPVGEKEGVYNAGFGDDLAHQSYTSLAHLRKIMRNRSQLGCRTLWGTPVSRSFALPVSTGGAAMPVDSNGFLSPTASVTGISYAATGWNYYGGRCLKANNGYVRANGSGVNLDSPVKPYDFPRKFADLPDNRTLVTCKWWISGGYLGYVTHTGKDSGGYQISYQPSNPTEARRTTKINGICAGWTDGSARWVDFADMEYIRNGAGGTRYYPIDRNAKR